MKFLRVSVNIDWSEYKTVLNMIYLSILADIFSKTILKDIKAENTDFSNVYCCFVVKNSRFN
jgi:hypothetical protein